MSQLSPKNTAYVDLMQTGDYDRFRELLKKRLIECGWCDQIQVICREIAREKGPSVTAQQLMDEVGVRGRALVPNAVKRELLQKVKEHLLKEAGYYDSQFRKKAEASEDAAASESQS